MSLLELPPEENREHLSRLAGMLDALVATYHQTSAVDPAGEADAPTQDYHDLLAKAETAFPELGFCAHVHPDEKIGAESDQGWALDHITDIARDFLEVRWHLENSTPEEAIWHFRFGFQHHWGEHLFSLRRYLHSTTIAAW